MIVLYCFAAAAVWILMVGVVCAAYRGHARRVLRRRPGRRGGMIL